MHTRMCLVFMISSGFRLFQSMRDTLEILLFMLQEYVKYIKFVVVVISWCYSDTNVYKKIVGSGVIFLLKKILI